MHRVHRWAASLAAVTGVVTASGAWAGDPAQAQQQGQGQGQAQGEGQSCPAASARPVLSVGDFNGDTLVDGEDLRLLTERVVRQDNVAFFDMSADGRVDMQDLRIVSSQVGARSTAMDQELAAIFRATERYRDIRNAIADDFIPYTPSFRGHGVHWGQRHPDHGVFKLTRPQGLNYSEDGRLLAVFYAYILDGTDLPDAPPAGLSGDDPWHGHEDLCFYGVDQSNPTYDFRALSLKLCIPKQECSAPTWMEKFYMIHVWLYEHNPCGVFGLDNPRVTEGSLVEEVGARCPAGGEQAGHAHGSATGAQGSAGHEHGSATGAQGSAAIGPKASGMGGHSSAPAGKSMAPAGGPQGKAMTPAGRHPVRTGQQQVGKGAAPHGPICLPPAARSGGAAPAASPPATPSPAPAAPAGTAPHTHGHTH